MKLAHCNASVKTYFAEMRLKRTPEYHWRKAKDNMEKLMLEESNMQQTLEFARVPSVIARAEQLADPFSTRMSRTDEALAQKTFTQILDGYSRTKSALTGFLVRRSDGVSCLAPIAIGAPAGLAAGAAMGVEGAVAGAIIGLFGTGFVGFAINLTIRMAAADAFGKWYAAAAAHTNEK